MLAELAIGARSRPLASPSMRAAAACSRSAVSIFNSPIARSKAARVDVGQHQAVSRTVDLRQDFAADRREVSSDFLAKAL